MTRSPTPEKFDVFLCHNSEDKAQIWEIYDQLVDRGLQPWIDEEHLQPGQFWLQVLGEQIDTIQSAAVFVGNSGMGPWQQQEIASFLAGFLRRNLPVIPVLLPNAPAQPKLPVFLENFTWVDFRKPRPDPVERLIWGITGRKTMRVKPATEGSPIIVAPQSVPHLEEDSLRSERGIDYTKLRDRLKSGDWRGADRETYKVMIRVVGRKSGDYIRNEELLNFPCLDLQTIDRLWGKYSGGKFGFSVQKKIYVECGAKLYQFKQYSRQIEHSR